MRWSLKSVFVTVSVALFAIGAMAGTVSANENAAAEGVPTFNADVASILYENCASCHRDGQVAPMSLTSYSEVRPWARAIKTKVVSREMPPWFADPRYGHFKNVPTLTQAEIDTVAAWADGGAPEGVGAEPVVPTFVSEWKHDRPPDFVLEMPIEFEVPAQGELEYVKLWVDNPWQEDVYLEAVQMRPGNAEVVHHAGMHTRGLPPGTKMGERQLYPGGQLIPQPVPMDENESEEAKRASQATVASGNNGQDQLLLFYAPGSGFAKYPEGTGKRVYGDRYIVFDNHYTLTGRPEKDRSMGGFWFTKEKPTHQVITTSGSGRVRIIENTEQLSADTGDCVGRERDDRQCSAAAGGTAAMPSHSGPRRRLQGHGDLADHRRHHDLRSVAAHALPWQGYDLHRQLPRWHGGGRLERADLRFQLAAGPRFRGTAQGSRWKHNQDNQSLRQQRQESLQPVT